MILGGPPFSSLGCNDVVDAAAADVPGIGGTATDTPGAGATGAPASGRMEDNAGGGLLGTPVLSLADGAGTGVVVVAARAASAGLARTGASSPVCPMAGAHNAQSMTIAEARSRGLIGAPFVSVAAKCRPRGFRTSGPR